MVKGTFIDATVLPKDAYEAAIENAEPQQGLLITGGPEAAEIICSAFPPEGYNLDMAREIRDMLLKYNAKHHLTPITL